MCEVVTSSYLVFQFLYVVSEVLVVEAHLLDHLTSSQQVTHRMR